MGFVKNVKQHPILLGNIIIFNTFAMYPNG